MGKIRRQRQKLHLKAKQKQSPSNSKTEPADEKEENGSALPLPYDVIFPTDGLFSKEDTEDLGFLRQQLPQEQKDEDDRMTYISKKSIHGEGQLKKKDKRKLRHERWLQKIDTIKQAKKSKKAAHQRSQAPIVGDMQPLSQALPELSEVLRLGETQRYQSQSQSRSNQKAKPKQNTMKTRERKQLLLEEQAKFKQVLAHSAFKSNPLATINEHLRNKMQKEQEEEEERMDDNT